MWMATRDRVLTTNEMYGGLAHALAEDTAGRWLRDALAEQHLIEAMRSARRTCRPTGRPAPPAAGRGSAETSPLDLSVASTSIVVDAAGETGPGDGGRSWPGRS